MIHQDNNGGIGSLGAQELNPASSRRPACIVLGEYRAGADQPIWFSDSKVFMDNDGCGIGPLDRLDCGVYSSMTYTSGCDVLWHPDRKFFLLGKKNHRRRPGRLGCAERILIRQISMGRRDNF